MHNKLPFFPMAFAILTIQFAACGSQSDPIPAPTVSSVTGIASGTTNSIAIAATGTTGVSGLASDPLTVTFSIGMDTNTINTNNISLSCAGAAQTISLSVADPSTDASFYVTPTADLPSQTECTLTITTGVLNWNGSAMANPATYTYTTG